MKSEHFKEGREQGTKYLLEQLSSDGQFGNPEAGVTDYYKVPSAFQVSGRNQSANLLIDWIRKMDLNLTEISGQGPRVMIYIIIYTSIPVLLLWLKDLYNLIYLKKEWNILGNFGILKAADFIQV